jgi:hypothetical protein
LLAERPKDSQGIKKEFSICTQGLLGEGYLPAQKGKNQTTPASTLNMVHRVIYKNNLKERE